MQLEHCFLVVHVDFNLLLRLGVRDGVAVLNGDFGTVVAAVAEESADYAVLVFVPAEGVVEDGEEGLRLECYVDGGGAGLGPEGCGSERATKMEEGVGGGHAGWLMWDTDLCIIICDGVNFAAKKCVNVAKNCCAL